MPEDVLTKARKRVEDERRGCNVLESLDLKLTALSAGLKCSEE